MANSQKPARFPGINGFATLGSSPDQSGLTGRLERLLEIFRAAIRYVSKDLDGAPVGAPPEHSSEHLDEPLLSGETAGPETLSLSREIDTCCQIV
jgi:hypothetical protein